MFTLTVDSDAASVNAVRKILRAADPGGQHVGACTRAQALKAVEERHIDAAFVSVGSGELKGEAVIKGIQRLSPLTNIIFICHSSEYMPAAFALYASAYILRPVTENAVRDALSHLRYRAVPAADSKAAVRVQCFGSFEVFKDGQPVRFRRAKSKELFAYLVDRRGAVCTNDMIIGNLWPDMSADNTRKSMTRTAAAEMIAAFGRVGVEEIIIKGAGGLAVNVGMLDCDYYRYLDGDPIALHQFRGEYMTRYDFAAATRAALL